MKIEEEMIDELFRHHHFLFQLKDYIQQTTQPNTTAQIDMGTEQPIDKLIDEISAAIVSISEPNFMSDIEQMKREIQSKYEHEIAQLKEEIAQESINLIHNYCKEGKPGVKKGYSEDDFNCDFPSLLPKNGVCSEIKENRRGHSSRKMLTESILECSRIEGEEKHHHDDNSVASQGKTQVFNSWHEESFKIRKKIKEMEQQCYNVLATSNKWHIECTQSIEQIHVDMGALRIQMTEKVDSAMGGVWNIITNLQDKFSTLQSLVAKMRK